MPQNFAARTALSAAGGVGFLSTDANGRLLVTSEAPAADAVSAFSADVANATATASLPAVAGRANRVAGILISATGATAASDVVATVSGLAGGTMEIPIAVPASATGQVGPISVNFTQPLVASGVNTAIVITLPALGAGNLHAAVSIWGDVG